MSYSATLDATLHRAVGLAAARKHRHTTLEHLLLALIDDLDAAEVMRACEVDLGELRKTLTSYVDDDLKSLVIDDGEDAKPADLTRMSLQELKDKSPGTPALHRVMQRAVVHVNSAGSEQRHGRQCAGGDLLRTGESRRSPPAAAEDGPARRRELHRPWHSQGRRQSGLGPACGGLLWV